MVLARRDRHGGQHTGGVRRSLPLAGADGTPYAVPMFSYSRALAGLTLLFAVAITSTAHAATIRNIDELASVEPPGARVNQCDKPTKFDGEDLREVAHTVDALRAAFVRCERDPLQTSMVVQFADSATAKKRARLMLRVTNYSRNNGHANRKLGKGVTCAQTYQDANDDDPEDDFTTCVQPRGKFVLIGVGEQGSRPGGYASFKITQRWFKVAGATARSNG